MTRPADTPSRAPAPGPLDIALLTIVFAIGVVIGWQGWNSTVITPDYISYLDNARALLREGRLPTSGHLASMTAFFPPGATYLFVPGLLLFQDPRLAETPVALLSHAGSLVFLFLIARHAFGLRAARLSVVLFGLSHLGLMQWDGFIVGHFYNPCLYLAAVWSLVLWVSRRKAAYLALMLGIVSLAVYVQHPVLLLTVAAAPVAWAIYRPPVSVASLVVVALGSALLWSPYLGFERARGFVDVTAMASGRSLLPVDYATAWCDPGLTLRSVAEERRVAPVEARLRALVGGPLKPIAPLLRRVAGMGFGLVSNVGQASNVPLVPVALLLGILVVPLRATCAWLRPAGTTSPLHQASPATATAMLGLFVPWMLLLLVIEPGRTDRALWLWPLQVMMLAAAATALVPRLRAPAVRRLAVVGLIAVVGYNPFMIGQVQDWHSGGWRGARPPILQAVAFVARETRAAGPPHTGIGYQIHNAGYTAWNHVVDRRYKVGMELDATLLALYGITNTDTCGEGLSRADDWRIIQTAVEPANAVWLTEIVQTDASRGFTLRARFGPYTVYRRDSSSR